VADVAARLHDSYLEAGAMANMGFELFTESRYDEAIPWFEKAVGLFTSLGAGDSLARNQGNLGTCYFYLGDYDNARHYYEKAQERFAKTGNRFGQQIWIGNAGNVPYQLGDFEGAEAAYKRALEIARQIQSASWIARWRNNLAGTLLEQGKWDAAETYNKEALEEMPRLEDKSWEPTVLVNAARIEEGRNHLDRARELFRSALAKSAADPRARLSAHAGLARTYIRDGRLREAEAEFQNTVAAIDQRGAKLLKDEYKLAYLSSLIQFYREYVDFLIASHRPEDALAVAESSRSHVLEERSGGRAAEERHTAAEYQQLARQTQSVLLEYWLSPKQSYLWVIKPNEIRIHTLPAAGTMYPLLESYRAVIVKGRNPLDAANETGQRLYRELLGPVPEAVVKGSRFMIVPDGELYSFPIESLPTPGNPRQYWIEEVTVATAPSLNYLVHQAHIRRAQPAMELLAIGDPATSSAQYPRLEFASQEIETIQSSMHAGKTVIRRNDAATPTSYAEAQPGRFALIHFAAHATANALSPLDSAVILSGSPESNRLLARSVMTIPLTAELVTISACRSASSRTYAGEGPVGFAWAFLRAGAGHVIAGLWDVPDRSTKELMAGLYRQLAAGAPVSEALRDAKLALIRSGGAYAKPLYWAPFQLYVGSAR
jgi:CHAT domain-containing protein